MLKKLIAGMGLMAAACAAQAEPLRFEFAYAQPGGGPASATGYIVLESTEIANPGRNEWNLPSGAVLDLSITIVGADAGNGTFDENDFGRVVFDTNGGTLDLSRSLMGQPTDNLPWGTPPTEETRSTTGAEPGISGDFNLFIEPSMPERQPDYAAGAPREPNAAIDLPPNGEWFYTLQANGGTANALVLTAFGPLQGHSAVPFNATWALVLLGLAMAAAVWFRQRRSA